MPLRGLGGPPALASAEAVGRPTLFAAIALSGVAAAVPITFILLPSLRELDRAAAGWQRAAGPAASAPAAVGLAVALTGLGRASRAQASSSHIS